MNAYDMWMQWCWYQKWYPEYDSDTDIWSMICDVWYMIYVTYVCDKCLGSTLTNWGGILPQRRCFLCSLQKLWLGNGLCQRNRQWVWRLKVPCDGAVQRSEKKKGQRRFWTLLTSVTSCESIPFSEGVCVHCSRSCIQTTGVWFQNCTHLPDLGGYSEYWGQERNKTQRFLSTHTHTYAYIYIYIYRPPKYAHQWCFIL